MNRTMLHIAALLLLTALNPAFAVEGKESGYPQIHASVKPDSATVGDLLEYRVSIAGKNAKNIQILLPEARIAYPDKAVAKAGTGEKGGEIEGGMEKASDAVPLFIIHTATKDDRSDKTVTDITVIMRMSYYRTGKHALPEIEILDTDKVKIGYRIPEVTIKQLNEKGEFQEIEPPLDLGGNYTRLILLLAGAVLFTLVGLFLYRKIRERIEEKRREVPAIPPIEIFRKEMERLKPGDLIGRGMIEEYVFGISTVFRKFLSLQFRFGALDMTSDEILAAMGKLISSEKRAAHLDGIERCFRLWDLSKFAEFAPSGELLLSNLDLAVKTAEGMAVDAHGNP